jgi:hypothetical protein
MPAHLSVVHEIIAIMEEERRGFDKMVAFVGFSVLETQATYKL